MLGVGDGELGHARPEVAPGERGLVLAEERERFEFAVGGSPVGEEEANIDVVGAGLGGGAGGEELEGHGGGVVDNAVEILAGFGELRETEEGHEGAVGAELGIESGGPLGAVDNGL